MVTNKVVKPEVAEPDKAVELGALINDLALLVANMNRITDYLQKAAKSANVNITLTDWLLLQALAAGGPLPMAKVAFKIGVTRQRIHQQVSPLQSAGLISIAQGDGKSKILEIDAQGKLLATTLEKEFLKSMTGEDGSLAAGPVRTAKMGTARLARAMMARSKADEHAQ